MKTPGRNLEVGLGDVSFVANQPTTEQNGMEQELLVLSWFIINYNHLRNHGSWDESRKPRWS
jgi:hypothetical protein